MLYPQTFIDDLARQADTVRIISDYVPLKKRGANWMACCPFHKEKTPSFSVNPSKGIFYCFGCGKGGSVFKFVMELERVSFPDAIRIVAEKSGVALPAMEDNKRVETAKREAEEVIKLNTWALEWWEKRLQESSPDAEATRDYLVRRGITEQTQSLFRLGYAPDSWDSLILYLRSKGATDEQIKRSGLVVIKDSGGFYDRFRGRVIFPVLDVQGRPVAFGGRTMAPDGEPKYLNSPETPAYIKGRHLFGLNLTKEEIKKKGFVILVEGYLDLIVPYQFGVRNLVASLGTALTEGQAKLLARFARKIVVNYDGDRAGIKAAQRAIEVLLAEDFEIKVLVLPDNADPDEFIRASGVEAYNERRGKALPHIQFVINEAIRGRNLLQPADKKAAVAEVLPSIRAVKNGILRREYFDMAMQALRIEESLLKELWQAVNRPNFDQAALEKRIEREIVVRPTVAEERLLGLLLHDDLLRREVIPHIESADYEFLPTSGIFRALINLEANGKEVNFDTLNEELASDPISMELLSPLMIGESLRAEGEAIDDFLAEAESCLATLRLMSIDRRLVELSKEITSAERAGNIDLRDKLVMEHVDWTRQRILLSNHLAKVTKA